MKTIENFQKIAHKITCVLHEITGIYHPLFVKGINGVYYLVDENTGDIRCGICEISNIKGYSENDFEIYLNKLLVNFENIKSKI